MKSDVWELVSHTTLVHREALLSFWFAGMRAESEHRYVSIGSVCGTHTAYQDHLDKCERT